MLRKILERAVQQTGAIAEKAEAVESTGAQLQFNQDQFIALSAKAS
jgi:hypothetical protein